MKRRYAWLIKNVPGYAKATPQMQKLIRRVMVVTLILIGALNVAFYGWTLMLLAGVYGLNWGFFHSLPLAAFLSWQWVCFGSGIRTNVRLIKQVEEQETK